MAQVRWYWHRLRAMSPEEIAYRLRFALKKQLWRRRRVWNASAPNWKKAEQWTLPALDGLDAAEQQLIIEEAERYMAGQYQMLNLSFHEPLIDWFVDPQSGIRAPIDFGPDINYRDPDRVGNVKNIWEKNRHHHLTILALSYALTKERRYAAEVERQLWSWVSENPFPLGVNWTSSLEVGVRLISWVWIDRLLRGTPEHERLFGEAGRLWSAVYWHQWMIAEHYSHGSSSNNHLLGEMAGLYTAALAWPYFPDSSKWRRMAKDIMEREAVNQTFPGGLNREQAFSYHIFSLEFFMLTGLEGERYGDSFSAGYIDLIKRMLEVIPLVTDVGGNVPRYGDEDQGMALQLRSMSSSRLDWLYQIGSSWIDADVPVPQSGAGLLTAQLIKPASDHQTAKKRVDEYGRAGGRRKPGIQVEDSGNYILTYRRGQPDEVFCLIDAAPIGYLSIAGHGHADALSFTLSAGGVPVIIDPGTYIYHADPAWRTYFRSTKAHNTITVDGQDQSVANGPFLWERKAQTKVLDWRKGNNGGSLCASHDGYARLGEPVTHQRRFTLESNDVVVEDDILGEGQHDVDCRLHFDPNCIITIMDAYICSVKWPGGHMKIVLDERLDWKMLCGKPDAGWYSSGFNQKQPIYTLSGTIRTHLPLKIITTMEVNHEN